MTPVQTLYVLYFDNSVEIVSGVVKVDWSHYRGVFIERVNNQIHFIPSEALLRIRSISVQN